MIMDIKTLLNGDSIARKTKFITSYFLLCETVKSNYWRKGRRHFFIFHIAFDVRHAFV